MRLFERARALLPRAKPVKCVRMYPPPAQEVQARVGTHCKRSVIDLLGGRTSTVNEVRFSSADRAAIQELERERAELTREVERLRRAA